MEKNPETLTQPQRWFRENRQKHAEQMKEYYYKNRVPRQNSLKKIRLNHGITQVQLADRLGINRKTIIRIERQEQNVNPKLAEEIGEVLMTAPEKIFPKSVLGRVRRKKNHGKKENS